jgi:hypothetical protein
VLVQKHKRNGSQRDEAKGECGTAFEQLRKFAADDRAVGKMKIRGIDGEASLSALRPMPAKCAA